MKPKRWSREEEMTLQELCKTMIPPQMAKVMGRTTGSIYSKIVNMEEKIQTKNKISFADAEEKREFDERAYQRLINEKVIAGVYKKDLQVKMGQSYEVTRNQGRMLKGDWKIFKGKVIQETKHHITIRNKVRAETFLKVDLLIGEYKIKEVVM